VRNLDRRRIYQYTRRRGPPIGKPPNGLPVDRREGIPVGMGRRSAGRAARCPSGVGGTARQTVIKRESGVEWGKQWLRHKSGPNGAGHPRGVFPTDRPGPRYRALGPLWKKPAARPVSKGYGASTSAPSSSPIPRSPFGRSFSAATGRLRSGSATAGGYASGRPKCGGGWRRDGSGKRKEKNEVALATR